MTHALPRPFRLMLMALLGTLLAACQSMPAPSGFSPAQVAALKNEGFVETGAGWELTLNERLLFASNESALHAEQIARLRTLAGNLVSVDITTARVEGHTDSTGSLAHNQDLSQRRAYSVANYLGDQGIDQRRVSAMGFGPSQPIASNASAAGRAQNRRVEITIAPITQG